MKTIEQSIQFAIEEARYQAQEANVQFDTEEYNKFKAIETILKWVLENL